MQMAAKIIAQRGLYAELSSNRTFIAFRTKGGPWRGLLLDFELDTAEWASPYEVRSMKTGKAWVAGLAGKRRGGKRKPLVRDIENLE